ncbi:MAG: flagellar biosynthesis anti-sigma factor FlgM [Gammaproteobacteria bacterium]|nr:flagellar biosynthesis anti-sigma factor FlgM [Gammaproteobacteria bacterium]
MNDVTKTNAKRSQPGSNQNNSIKSQNEEKQNNQSKNSASIDKNASSVDSVRVAEVQSAISNGEYTVDANRIADKILAFEDFKNK